MSNLDRRRDAKALTILSTSALLLLSLQATASESPAARERSAATRSESASTAIQLAPVSEFMPQLIVDGSFEAGIPNPNWTETSTNFGTPLCDALCGTGGGTAGPRTGAIWSWFGGVAAPETATLGQTVTIPSGVTASLTFWMRIGAVSSPFTDVLNVRVDGTVVQTFPEPAVAEATYTLRTINMDAFANGSPHTILFEYIGPTSGVGNFNVDDVELNTAAAATVAPTALAVDAAGNGVLQPNEIGTVAPSWRNTGAATIASLTGTLSNFTGPMGGTYTILDSTANYGAIAAGATASCTSSADCYTVQATAATRPALHWDTTALETVSTGPTTKTWTIHIGDSFTDVPPTNGFYRFVETIFHKGVTGGCGGTNYCPTAVTTREQMAVFVLTAKGVPAPVACVAGSEMFLDVPASSPFCRWIEELVRRGIASGCAPQLYCPTAPATREQMAVFVLKTLDPMINPPACVPPNLFLDVPETSGFCRWIEELANRGVVTGCGSGNYCPTASVTREQMGVFLAVAFGLTLYGI